MKNKLIIASEGTGKTKYLIDRALTLNEKVLITTFTINWKNEIIENYNKKKKCIYLGKKEKKKKIIK